VARLATQTGLFPVFEAEHGDVVSATPLRRPAPVEEYLRIQGRYGHLFGPDGQPAHPDVIAALQTMADRNIERYGLLGDVPENYKPVGLYFSETSTEGSATSTERSGTSTEGSETTTDESEAGVPDP
jgi:hypothetical protein